jgi:uncharacterized protein (TIGR03083 family)
VETDPSRWITTLAESHDRLRSLVERLDGPGVRAPAYPTEWTIAQVVSHLGSGGEIFLGFLDAGLAGAEPPGREQFEPIWAAWNTRTPEAQVADGLAVDTAFVERVAGLDPAVRDGLHLPMFGMDIDIVGLLRMRLSEHAVHTWDVAVALDASATVAPGPTALLIDTLGPLVARAGKPSDESRQVRVRTTDPERDLLLDLGDSASLRPFIGGDTPARLALPAEAFIRLVYGRLDPAHTPAVQADGIGLDELRRIFPGF